MGVTLRNNQTGQVIEDETRPEYISYYRGEGWVELTEQAAELVEQDGAGEFDPAAHTVNEVDTYLAGVDEDEQQRVLDAEAAGKARKSLLGDE